MRREKRESVHRAKQEWQGEQSMKASEGEARWIGVGMKSLPPALMPSLLRKRRERRASSTEWQLDRRGEQPTFGASILTDVFDRALPRLNDDDLLALPSSDVLQRTQVYIFTRRQCRRDAAPAARLLTFYPRTFYTSLLAPLPADSCERLTDRLLHPTSSCSDHRCCTTPTRCSWTLASHRDVLLDPAVAGRSFRCALVPVDGRVLV